MKQIVLDVETTGLDPTEGHRIIEIGCVELIAGKKSGNTFHRYLNPNQTIDEQAVEIHGLSNEFLSDKPFYKDVESDFLAFIKDH